MKTTYRKHRIKSTGDPYFPEAHDIYTHSFPAHEQRTLEDLQRRLNNPDFHYSVFLNDAGELIALRNAWFQPDFVYLEHFAVSPHHRSGGIGKYLLDDLTAQAPGKVILEIDPVVDEISARRLNFYKRNGFVANEQYNYIHPPYKKGDEPYPLLVMSHKAPLPRELYDKFETYHHTVLVDALPE